MQEAWSGSWLGKGRGLCSCCVSWRQSDGFSNKILSLGKEPALGWSRLWGCNYTSNLLESFLLSLLLSFVIQAAAGSRGMDALGTQTARCSGTSFCPGQKSPSRKLKKRLCCCMRRAGPSLLPSLGRAPSSVSTWKTCCEGRRAGGWTLTMGMDTRNGDGHSQGAGCSQGGMDTCRGWTLAMGMDTQ